ncbi:MAG: EAL domain-containing protein [Actinomycetota bacterium]|nr:EAL domain-containing protein [Actinomycetota bacterium]
MSDIGHAEAWDTDRPPPAILLVNDREGQRVAIRAMLAPLGLVVVEADSGRAALRAVLNQTFALILMDVQMPTMDGYETATLIRGRSQSSRTPIIFVTAFGRDETETLTAYASGAVDFIFTPVHPEMLRAKVAIFVNLFVQSQELRLSVASITKLNAALRDSEASTQAVLDNVADGIVIVGETGAIESVNRSAEALFGYREDEAVGQPVTSFVAPQCRDDLLALPSGAEKGLTGPQAQSRSAELLGLRQDGSTFPMEVQYGALTRGRRRLTLASVRDISERRAYTESLQHQALHDGLTGLANRILFGELVLKALASAKRANEPQAILVMDLDGFKQVNDTLGHGQGDALLKQVGDRVVGALREVDTIARLGGDEFAILPGRSTNLAGAVAVAWKIQQTCAEGFTLGGKTVHVTASLGIAMFPEHGRTAEELLRRADVAMYIAKRTGSGHAVVDAAQEAETAEKLALLVDLRQCISHDELVLHYQPKIDLETHEVSGVEALVRWRHPERGLLMPVSFMPEVESTELIGPVTRWVLNEALRQQQEWAKQGIDLTVAVNISARSLGSGSSLPDIVRELTETWKTPPGRLILELTESALIEASAPEILAELHGMGEALSIDDFGTGYSSLAYLQRLPVDELKIDKSFVTGLSTAGDDALIVRSTIDLAHNLGLTVVAEGVEDETAKEMLAGYGCDRAQGYFIARPCPADEFIAWLAASPYASPYVARTSVAA